MNIRVSDNSDFLRMDFTAWKVSRHGVFSGPNTGKYRPEKTLYLDNFHAVLALNSKPIILAILFLIKFY